MTSRTFPRWRYVGIYLLVVASFLSIPLIVKYKEAILGASIALPAILALALPLLTPLVAAVVAALYMLPLGKIFGQDWILEALVFGMVFGLIIEHFTFPTVMGLLAGARVLIHIGNWIEKRRAKEQEAENMVP